MTPEKQSTKLIQRETFYKTTGLVSLESNVTKGKINCLKVKNFCIKETKKTHQLTAMSEP